MTSPKKSCEVGPLLTTLLKACLDTLLYPFKILDMHYDALACVLTISNRTNCTSNVLQTAYKQFNSTEIALLKVHNDVPVGKITVHTLRDLSATFDMIDRNILIKRLSIWYSVWQISELIFEKRMMWSEASGGEDGVTLGQYTRLTSLPRTPLTFC